MSAPTYQIIKEDKYHNREILATGVDQATAEYGLVYEGLDPRRVRWGTHPVERPDPRGGWSLIYFGIYHE